MITQTQSAIEAIPLPSAIQSPTLPRVGTAIPAARAATCERL
jgi:hypothetical protein